MSPLDDFWAAWPLFEYPALAGTLIGMTLGALGVYVVLRRLVFLSAATSQAASLGVVLSFYLAAHVQDPHGLLSPAVFAVALSFGACLLMMRRSRVSAVSRDALLGGIFLVGGGGTLFLGGFIPEELHDVQTLLLGNAVAVLPDQFNLVAWLFPLLLVVQLVWWRGFSLASFSGIVARVRGLPVGAIEVTLFLCLALAVSVGTQTIGALPVFAMSVLPAVVGIAVAPNVPAALLLAAAIGALAGLYGYMLAFVADTPVGASQVLVAALFAALTVAARALPGGRSAGLARWRRSALGVGAVSMAVVGTGIVLTPLLSAWWPGALELVRPLAYTSAAIAVAGAALAWPRQGRHRTVMGVGGAITWLSLGALMSPARPVLQPVIVGFGALAVARWLHAERMCDTVSGPTDRTSSD